MWPGRAPRRSASDRVRPPPAEAVARFRRDAERLLGRVDPATGDPGQLIALAVSGGPDSMAMLALAAAAFPGQVVAATVDHGLRADAAAEAATVARVCGALDVAHATLHPAAPITGNSLQMRAREARYDALARWMAREGCRLLFTAHHADDQAETLLMRLNRASGLSGLASIRAVRRDGETLTLRPLLGWRRAELRAIAEVCALPFVDDPANADPRHDRTQVRALLAEASVLDPRALAASVAHLADAEEVVAEVAERWWAQRWQEEAAVLVLDDLPREVRRRLVRRAIGRVRAVLGIESPRFDASGNVESLLDSLASGRGATHAGVQVIRAGGGWHFRRAPPRRSV